MKFKNGLLFLVFIFIVVFSVYIYFYFQYGIAGEDGYREFSYEGGYTREKIKKIPGIYEFSQSLINNAEKCNPYEEDFYETNKKDAVLIQIKGKTKKGNCEFKINLDYGRWITSYECTITPKQQAKLVAAMKSGSKKSVHKTIKYEQKIGKNAEAKGMEPQKGELDVTGDEFTVLINEIFKTSCTMDFE